MKKVKMWAVVWNDGIDNGICEAYMEGAVFLYLFRTRAEARKHCDFDKRVVRVEVSVNVVKAAK